jgi:SpoIIAA-like
MVELLNDLPPGVIGYRISGRITSAEYQKMLDPVLAALDRGDRIDLLVVVEDGFQGLDAGALWDDFKAAGPVGLKHRSSWRKVAVVTNKEWLHHLISGFGRLYPGELRGFRLDELEAATAWLAEPA